MEKTEHQLLHSLNQFSRHQILVKLIQFLVSVSVFSFIILCNSSLHSFIEFFSFPFQLFSHSIDKNCIFLFCNGVLFFVAKTSGSVSSCYSPVNNDPSIDQSVEHFDDYYDAPPRSSVLLDTVINQERELQPIIKNKQEINDETNENNIEEDESLVAKEEEKLEISDDCEETILQEEVMPFDDEFPVDVEEEEEYDDEEENGKLSNDELNKKFDDFIRKMKEGIRIEAHRQSFVLVH